MKHDPHSAEVAVDRANHLIAEVIRVRDLERYNLDNYRDRVTDEAIKMLNWASWRT